MNDHFAYRKLMSSLAIALGILIFFWVPARLGVGPSESIQAASLAQRNIDPRQSPCLLDLEQRARPNLLLLGETTDLVIRVRATCPDSDTPLHIVLVMDASGSMAGDPTREMKRELRGFVDRLDLAHHPTRRVGVVQFNSTARTLCTLSNDAARIDDCIGRIGAHGGSAIDRGIQEALHVMRQGRNLASGQIIHEIMIVLSDGGNEEGCQPVQQAARSAKGQGIRVVSICLGSGCDAACMREVASSARYMYQAADSGELGSVFERIFEQVFDILLRQLVLMTALPDNMEYITDSAQPPVDLSWDGKRLKWQWNFMPKDGVTVALAVRPLEVGGHPVTLSSTVEYRDKQNRYGSADGLAPWVHVFRPAVPVTPNDPPPPPTP